MDRIFLTHLHGDHVSDVTHIYCFGPASDRLTPLYVWGPGPSVVPNPKPPHQLYDNREPGVRITHFPVIHCRKGSIACKLEWNGLSMIFSGDTKPEKISIDQAKNGGRGVTVLVHEMVVPAEIWAMQAQHLPRPPAGANQLWDDSVDRAISVPKYHFENGLPDPYAQIDRTQEIQAGEQTYCRSGY